MDVHVIAELYGGLPEHVVARAREVLRLARAKSSLHEDMKTPVACLVVACRALEEPLDVKKLAMLLNFSARALDQAARKIANLVNVKSEQKITPTTLCVRHGCAAITEFVNRVYDEYQVVAQQLARGKARSGGGVRLFDPTEPVFAAACLFACAKRAKLRIDRPRLIADTNANPRTFEAIVSSIEKQCQSTLTRSTGASATVTAGRGRLAPSATSAAGASVRVSTEKAPMVMTKAAQRAALVLDKAVAEKETKAKKSRAIERVQAATQAQVTASVTPKEYQAWRAKVLFLRRQTTTEDLAVSPAQSAGATVAIRTEPSLQTEY